MRQMPSISIIAREVLFTKSLNADSVIWDSLGNLQDHADQKYYSILIRED